MKNDFQSQGGGGPLLEAAGRDDGCVHGGALVGGEVGSGRLCCPCPIIIVQRLVGDALI